MMQKDGGQGGKRSRVGVKGAMIIGGVELWVQSIGRRLESNCLLFLQAAYDF